MKSQNLYSYFRTILFLVSILFSALHSGTAQAQTASEYLNEMHILYNQRFDQNGTFIDDPAKTAAFSEKQMQVIQTLRNKGHIGQAFQIYNTAMQNLVITVSVVQELNHNFVGLMIERSQYDNATTASFLRLFNFTILLGGMDVLRLQEGPVIRLQSTGLTAAGGKIKIRYPLDFNRGEFAESVITINSEGSKTDFLNPDSKSFSVMTLDLWFKIFSQNFGVREVIFE